MTPTERIREALERRDPIQAVIPGVIPPEEFLARIKTIPPRGGSAPGGGRRQKLQAWEYAGMTPTRRTLAYMRAQGYMCDVVEHRVAKGKGGFGRSRDLWGFADILCVGKDVIAVQTTSGSNMAARIKKIAESPKLAPVMAAGVRVICHGWAKRKAGWVLKELEL